MAYQKYCQIFCTLYLYGCTVAVCCIIVIINGVIVYGVMAHLTPYKMAGVQNFVLGLGRKVGEKHLQKS